MLRTLLHPIDWTLSFIASLLRLGAGRRGREPSLQGEPIILYEFEYCPFCRISREAISASGVRTDMRPCPKGGTRYRPEVQRLGGKVMFPYMVDPNTGTAMYESADIAAHVRRIYGHANRPIVHWLGPVNLILSMSLGWVRLFRGMFARPAPEPGTPPELYAAERSPGARLVREVLCEKEIRYFWSPVPLEDITNPVLVDHNSGERIIGALAILHHLDRSYARA